MYNLVLMLLKNLTFINNALLMNFHFSIYIVLNIIDVYMYDDW